MARKLLSNGQAAVFRRYPFTIILKRGVDTPTHPIKIKLDPGSKTTGIALLKGDKLIFVVDLNHREQAIKTSFGSRRAIRQNRRARHTRYRQARFLNRNRPKGWLAPSLKHRVDTTLTWVNKFIRFAPVDSITMEVVWFDLQQLENSEIYGVEYQQGGLLGYEIREYLLNKWDRKCTYCKTKNIPLQVEHIHPKTRGGSNRISNLCLGCEKCNIKKGIQDIKSFLSKKPDLLRQIMIQVKRRLKDATAVNSTRWVLLNQLQLTGLTVTTGSGGQTKYNRTRLELPKTHYFGAACVGKVDKLVVLTAQPLSIKTNGHGSRRICRAEKFGFPSRYIPRDKFVKGFQTGGIVKAVGTNARKIGKYVGRVAVRSSDYFNILAKELVPGINHKYYQIIYKKDGICTSSSLSKAVLKDGIYTHNFDELMSRKLNAVIPDETWEALDEIASREMRTKSQMAAILLGEAITEYRKRHSLKDTEADLADSTERTQGSPTGNTTPPATKARRGKGSKSVS